MKSAWHQTCAFIRDTTASDKPFATSGAISTMSAVYAVSLLRMSLILSQSKIKDRSKLLRLQEYLRELEAASKELSRLSDKDVQSFHSFLEALKIPKEPGTRSALRSATVRITRLESIRVPLQTSKEILKTLGSIRPLISVCSKGLLCDLLVAANLMCVSIINLGLNIIENSRALSPGKRDDLSSQVKLLNAKARAHLKKLQLEIGMITGY